MFVRDHLAVVAHWARDQLRDSAGSPEQSQLLQQLIDAADALRQDLAPSPRTIAANVVALDEFRQRAS